MVRTLPVENSLRILNAVRLIHKILYVLQSNQKKSFFLKMFNGFFPISIISALL